MHVVRLLCIISNSMNLFSLHSEVRQQICQVNIATGSRVKLKSFIFLEHHSPTRDRHTNSPFEVKRQSSRQAIRE